MRPRQCTFPFLIGHVIQKIGGYHRMYDEILNEALRTVVEDFDSGKIRLETEGDLRGFLFQRCVEILSHRRHPSPIPIHAETPIGKGPHKREEPTPDLTIGPDAE